MDWSKKNVYTSLAAIIILGAFLRFYHLGATSFVADEFLDINSSYAYAKTGVWQAWNFNFDSADKDNVNVPRDTRAWIYKWQVAKVIKAFSPSESAARSVSALWGVISVILIYFVASYFTKKREIGLLAAFLFAISVNGIIFDRRLRMYAMFFPVFLSLAWLLFLFLESEYRGKLKLVKMFYDRWGVNVIYLVPAAIMAAVSLSVHQLTGNIAIIFLVYAAFRFFQTKKDGKLWFNKYFLSLLFLLVSMVSGFLFFSDKASAFMHELEFFNWHWTYVPKVFSDYSNILLSVLFLVVGIHYLYSKEKLKKEALWLSVAFLSVLMSAIFLWKQAVGDQYIFFIESFSIILIAAGIYGAAAFFGANLGKFGKKPFYATIILSLLILPNWGYFAEDSNTYKQTSQSDSPNFRKVFSYFKKARSSEDVLVTRNFRNYYWGGAKVKVFDFGGELAEDKLSLEDIKNISAGNPRGWFVVSDNDESYVSNEAMDYAAKNFQRVSNLDVRGPITVYRWGNQDGR